jgi:type I restriction enzyme S subunit
VREGWITKPLGELCRIEIGGTPPRSNSKFWDEKKATDNVWVSIADMPKTLHARISTSAEHLSDEGAERVKLVKAGTLLVSFKLTLGRLAYADIDLRTNEAIAALTLIDVSLLSKEYLYWYLTFFDWQRAAEGEDKIKGKTLNKAKLAVLPIFVPPFPEQQRIVAILDEVFAGLTTATANAEKNLENARELFDSYLDLAVEGLLVPQHSDETSVEPLIEQIERLRAAKLALKKRKKPRKMLSHDAAKLTFVLPKHWRAKRLEELTSAIADGVHKTPKYVSKGIPFVTVKNLTVGPGISFDDINYVTRADHEKFIKRTHPEKGDILITKDGTIGVVRVVDTDIEFSIFVSVALIKPIMRELTRYLAYAVSASCVQRQIAPKGAALKHLYLVDLRNLLIPFPPLAEQMRIVKELDSCRAQIDRLEAAYQEKLSSLAELKQSILQKAFSGELNSPPSQAIRQAAE